MKTSKAVEANIRVHEALLAAGEYEKSPHRRQESIDRVRGILGNLKVPSSEGHGAVAHLDIGCGDGFVFECVPDRWTSSGVDASKGMLARCAEKHPGVVLYNSCAEEIDVPAGSFDVITCYSFLDHLEERAIFYREVFRLLRSGGMFFFGLSPNRLFSDALRAAEFHGGQTVYPSSVVESEIDKAWDNGKYYSKEFGISEADLVLCEPGKTAHGGMDPAQELDQLKRIGFGGLRLEYHWIMAQHLLDPTVVRTIESVLPISSSAFKYFDMYGQKP